MCDESDLARWAKGVSRREFAAMGAAATLLACTASDAGAAGLAEQMVAIEAGAGTMGAFFVHPASGAHPAVILWPDIAGLREAKKAMARRLAAEGYAVLVANPYYRDVPAPQFSDFADFAGNGGFQKVGPWRAKLTAEAIMADAAALVAWLGGQAAADAAKGIGTQGYCMGGPFTVWSAAGSGGRIAAAASFHGGGLVGEDPKAPVNLLDDAAGTSYLFAIAQNDDAKSPTDKDMLRKAADVAGAKAEVEVYAADHGWTVPDSPAYDQPEAERAWTRLLALYANTLKQA